METEISKPATSLLLFVDSAPKAVPCSGGENLGLLNAWEKAYFPQLLCVFGSFVRVFWFPVIMELKRAGKAFLFNSKKFLYFVESGICFCM